MTTIQAFTLAGHAVENYCIEFTVERNINSVSDSFVGRFAMGDLDSVHVPAEGDEIIISYSTTGGVVGQFYGNITNVAKDLAFYTIESKPSTIEANFAIISRSYSTATDHDVIMRQLFLDAGIGTVTNTATVHQSVSAWRTSNQTALDGALKLSFLSKGASGASAQTVFMAAHNAADTAYIADIGATTPAVADLDQAAGNVIGDILRIVLTDEKINKVVCVHSAGSRAETDGTGGTRSILVNYPELSSGSDSVAGDAGLVTGTYLVIYKTKLTQYVLKVPTESLYGASGAFAPLNSRYDLVYQGATLTGLVCVKHVITWPSMVDEITLGDYTLDISKYLSQQGKKTGTMEKDWAGGALAFKGHMAAGSWSIPAGNNPVPFETEDYDLGDSFDTTAHQFIAPIAGVYLITWSITVNMTNGAICEAIQSQNGTTVGYDGIFNNTGATRNVPYKGTIVLKMAKGEYFEIRMQNASGTNIVQGGNAYRTQITGNLIVPL